MKAKAFLLVTLAAAYLGLFLACKESSPVGPNDLDGETNIDLTKVGNTYGAYVSVGDQQITVRDTIYITKNDNGFVTVRVWAETKDNALFTRSSLLPGKMLKATLTTICISK